MVEGLRFRSAVTGKKKSKAWGGGGPAASSFLGFEIGLGLGYFFLIFLIFQNCPPLLSVLRGTVFIGKNIVRLSNLNLQFFFL